MSRFAVVSSLLFAGIAPADGPPNFVLVMADDLGWGDLGCYGNAAIRTPHLDALAAAGMRFTDFHSNGVVCSPTRAALLTGRYQQRTGIEGVIHADPNRNQRDTGLPHAETTFAEDLAAAGYATGIFGKWHLGYPAKHNPTTHGFDRFVGFVSGNVDYQSHIDGAGFADWWSDSTPTPQAGYTTDLIGQCAAAFAERHRDRPFCLYIPHEAPHSPFQGPNDPAVRRPGLSKPQLGERTDRKAAYREMIEAMDASVGRVLDTLDRRGLSERTFVFFCSDNGPTNVGSAGPWRGRKGQIHEGGHRVPAIARWPGRIPAGVVTDQPAMTMDLLPTLRSLADLPPAEGRTLDGADLSPLLLRRQPPPDRPLFWVCDQQRAVRLGRHKLLLSAKGNRVPIELYDLQTDPGETDNLAADQPERVRRMQTLIDDFVRRTRTDVNRRS